MSLYNAILWLDHDEAFVFRFDSQESHETVVLHKRQHHLRQHPKDTGKSHDEQQDSYFRSIEHALAGASEIVMSGPSTEKFEFAKHLGKSHKALCDSVIAIEKVDRASDSEMLALARKYFKLPAEMVHSSYLAGL